MTALSIPVKTCAEPVLPMQKSKTLSDVDTEQREDGSNFAWGR